MKLNQRGLVISNQRVAPFMGAWIETFTVFFCNHSDAVAPFMGAWIETVTSVSNCVVLDSRTLHGCVD